jgi:hypothetical protein
MYPSQRELFFCGLGVLVEGPEDVGYIATQFALSEQMSEFRRLGCHFVVAAGKGKMSRLVAIAQELEIPVFVVVDADRDTTGKNTEQNRKDNECLLNLFSLGTENPLPDNTVWHDNLVMWPRRIGDTVAGEMGGAWEVVENGVRKERGLEDGVRRKNPILITAMLEELSKQGKRSTSLVRLCNAVLRYAQKVGMQ